MPAPFAEDGFLRRFLGIFDELSQSVQLGVDGLEHLADPSVAPPVLVRWLGGWLGVESIDPSAPELRQRALVIALGRLLWFRGTTTGIEGLLELLTGGTVDVTDSGGVFARGSAPAVNPRMVWVHVHRAGRASDEHLLAVVRSEIPVDVSFELRVGDRLVWPPARRGRSGGGSSGRSGGTGAGGGDGSGPGAGGNGARGTGARTTGARAVRSGG